jgi:DNA-binding winged helix-turn-helix (wHTH) protein
MPTAPQPPSSARVAFGRLQRQPFQILVFLLGHPGEVVTREQLRDQLWSDGTFVDFEHGLNAAINRLREALGDDADKPRFIETLPRLGYRFIAPVLAHTAATVAAEPAATKLPIRIRRIGWVALSRQGSPSSVW